MDPCEYRSASGAANPMRFVTGCVYLLLTIATVQALVGCGSPKFPSAELVIFTAFGPHAFEGRVLVARPDGSDVTTVLSPQSLLGYEGAFGNSLKLFILVAATQSTGGNNSITNIVEYFPSTGRSLPIQQRCHREGKAMGFRRPTTQSS